MKIFCFDIDTQYVKRKATNTMKQTVNHNFINK